MSTKDYGSKLAESLRQARQLGAQPTASPAPARAPTPPAPPAPAVQAIQGAAKPRASAPAAARPPVRDIRQTAASLHPARIWPD